MTTSPTGMTTGQAGKTTGLCACLTGMTTGQFGMTTELSADRTGMTTSPTGMTTGRRRGATPPWTCHVSERARTGPRGGNTLDPRGPRGRRTSRVQPRRFRLLPRMHHGAVPQRYRGIGQLHAVQRQPRRGPGGRGYPADRRPGVTTTAAPLCTVAGPTDHPSAAERTAVSPASAERLGGTMALPRTARKRCKAC